MSRTPKSSGKARHRDYGRKPGKRSAALVYLCCEGEKTEPFYLRSLTQELRLSQVKIYGGCRHVGEVCDRIAPGDQDAEVFWLFDAEGPDGGVRVDDYLKQAGKEKIKPVVSNPCFEYWLLLHFERASGDFLSAASVIDALKKYIPNYNKSDPGDAFRRVREHRKQALAYAAELRQSASEHWKDHACPSTDVGCLVQKLERMSRQRPWE